MTTLNKTISERLREVAGERSICETHFISLAITGERPSCIWNCDICRSEWTRKLADAIEAERTNAEHGGVDVDALRKVAEEMASHVAVPNYKRGASISIGRVDDWWQRIRDAVEGAKPQLPEGIEWPRFEDGALVKLGDEFVNTNGNTSTVTRIALSEFHYTINKGQGRICKTYGKPVKRPEPEVLDADGVHIKVGDTVWYADGIYKGEKRIITGITLLGSESFVGFSNGFTGVPEELTHRKPDTQEAIDNDMTLSPTTYWEKVLGKGADEFTDYASMIEAMCADLLRRQRELMGGE